MRYFAADTETYVAPRSDDYVIRDESGAPVENLDGQFVYDTSPAGRAAFAKLETGVWLAGFVDVDDHRLFTDDERDAVQKHYSAREHVEAILSLPEQLGEEGVTVCYHNLPFDWPFLRWVLMTELGFVQLRRYQFNTGQVKYFVGTDLGYTIYNNGTAVNVVDTHRALQGSIAGMGRMLEASGVGGVAVLKGETPLVEIGKSIEDYTHSENDPTGRGRFRSGDPWTWEQAEEYVDGDILILAKTMRLMKIPEQYDNGLLTTAQYAVRAFLDGGLPDLRRDPEFHVLHAPQYYSRPHQAKDGEMCSWIYEAPGGPVSSSVCIDRRYPQFLPVSPHPESSRADLRAREIYNQPAREAYKGGLNWVNPDMIGKSLGAGRVYDITSMYPYIYATMPLPRDPVEWLSDGVPLNRIDRTRLFIFKAYIDATVKPGCLPALKCRTDDKYNRGMCFEVDADGEVVQYGGEPVLADQRAVYSPHLCYPNATWWTSVEFDYLYECYNIDRIEVTDVIYYERDRVFEKRLEEHCRQFIEMKDAASKKFDSNGVLVAAGDPFLRQQAKICLNSLYGALARTERVYHEETYELDPETGDLRDTSTRQITSGSRAGDAVVGAFITAYGRTRIARDANEVGLDRVAYIDTDSLHCIGTDDPTAIEIGDAIGQYKVEAQFSEAVFLKPKTYAEAIVGEEGNPSWISTCAGVTKQIKRENFYVGYEFTDTRRVDARGGSLLVQVAMRIQPPHQVRFKPLDDIMSEIAPKYIRRIKSRRGKRRPSKA